MWGQGTADWVMIDDAEVTVATDTGATLVIDFMADSLCESNDNSRARCMVRVRVDGKKAQPGKVIFDSDYSPDHPKVWIDDQHAAHSMRWATWVPAGDHTVTVEWKPAALPTVFKMRTWTLTVMTAESAIRPGRIPSRARRLDRRPRPCAGRIGRLRRLVAGSRRSVHPPGEPKRKEPEWDAAE